MIFIIITIIIIIIIIIMIIIIIVIIIIVIIVIREPGCGRLCGAPGCGLAAHPVLARTAVVGGSLRICRGGVDPTHTGVCCMLHGACCMLHDVLVD